MELCTDRQTKKWQIIIANKLMMNHVSSYNMPKKQNIFLCVLLAIVENEFKGCIYFLRWTFLDRASKTNPSLFPP